MVGLSYQGNYGNSGDNDDFRRLLWFLLGATRGGQNRARILHAIRARPCNLNQLAKSVGVDYRSVQHHMRILLKNSLVVASGERYGMVYSIHPWLEHHFGTFEEICSKLGISFPGVEVKLPVQPRRTSLDLTGRLIPKGASLGSTTTTSQ